MEKVTPGKVLAGPGMETVYTVVTEIVTVISPIWTDGNKTESSDDTPLSREDSTTIGMSVEKGGNTVQLPVFPPSPIYPFLIKVCLIGFVLVITIVGNVLVLVSFATTRKLQTYTNYYLVGLAVADLVSGGVTPALLNATFLVGYWPFGLAVCRAFIYLNTVFVHATFLITFIICVDRYRAMSKPLKHLKEKNKRHALKMILPGFLIPALLWAIVILILPEFGVFAPLPPYKCYIPYASNKLVLIASSLFISWIPIFGTSILYAVIYFGIIRKRPARRPTTQQERNSASFVESDPSSGPDLSKERGLEKVDGPTENGAETEGRTNQPPTNEKLAGSTGDVRQATVVKNRLSRGTSVSSNHRRSASSRRATRTLAYIILVMVISGTPWFFYSVVVTLVPSVPRYPLVNWFVAYVIHLSSATNPFLYAICNPVFKEAFLRILCRCCQKKK